MSNSIKRQRGQDWETSRPKRSKIEQVQDGLQAVREQSGSVLPKVLDAQAAFCRLTGGFGNNPAEAVRDLNELVQELAKQTQAVHDLVWGAPSKEAMRFKLVVKSGEMRAVDL